MTDAIYPVISTQVRLPFYLTGIGISDPEYHVCRSTGLASHQFLFTSEGSGVPLPKAMMPRIKRAVQLYLLP